MLSIKFYQATSLFPESVYISPSCLPCPAHPHSAACCKPYFPKKGKTEKCSHLCLVTPSPTLPLSFSLLPVTRTFLPSTPGQPSSFAFLHPRSSFPISIQISYKISCLKISPHRSAMPLSSPARLFKQLPSLILLIRYSPPSSMETALVKIVSDPSGKSRSQFSVSSSAHQHSGRLLLSASRALSSFLHFLNLSVFC